MITIVAAQQSHDLIHFHRLVEQRYPNLCSACKDPFRCSDSDEFSGYEGTIRCLTQGFGQVAWTSYTVVRQMFGVSYHLYSYVFVVYHTALIS